MMRKFFAALFLMLSIVLLSASCASTPESGVAGTYCYEKDGFFGSFTLSVREDGTFSYSEGPLSSYAGMGTWTLEDDVLCLSDGCDPQRTHYFHFDGSDLVFIADRSADFSYVKVLDAEKFIRIDQDH